MKILFLTKYSFSGASSRYRVYQYVPYLRNQGFNIMVCPLLNEDLFQKGYPYKGIGVDNIPTLTRSAITRIKNVMVDARCADLVVVQKDLFYFKEPLLEALLRSNAKKLLVDLDDFIAFKHGRGGVKINRSFLDLMSKCDGVIAGSHYLQRFACFFNSRSYYLPTTVDTDRYVPNLDSSVSGKTITIGWIGSPTTRKELEELIGVIERLGVTYQLKLSVCGLEALKAVGVETETIRWSYNNEIDFLKNIDIGIMPLRDDLVTRGKCGLKLLQYMAFEKPVVASPVGANLDIVDNGVNGYLVRSKADWVKALSKLIEDKTLRTKMGQQGRKKVEQEFSLTSGAETLMNILNKYRED